MVNRVGPTFVTEMADKTGAGPGDIARAYTVSRDAFALRALWTGIEALDNKVPAATQYEMIAATQGLMNRTIPWFLINAPQPLDLGAEAANYTPGVEELTASLDKVIVRGGPGTVGRAGRPLGRARAFRPIWRAGWRAWAFWHPPWISPASPG